ncbi:MAG TPA: type II toxin-antitoxin system HicA family toxin [bacterium]|nr:type II toxin-antitoxin system HicA family toxin [bacterium]
MGKVPVLSGRDVCAVLARHGFAEVRRRGSHIVMQKKFADSTVTVPIPDHKELRKGTVLGIIKQSRIPKAEFER